ncbi:MAG: cytochrome b [Alphaproteobacteria bacterium]|nr:cytochrome b [Alphaproteobacteria bacterium]
MEDGGSGYDTTARVLHWLVAVLVLLMAAAGLTMIREGIGRGLQDLLYIFHKNVGTALIVIVALRLFWRLTHGAPPLPVSVPPWQRLAARLSHWALYGLLIIMPLSGYVRVRAGGFPVEALDALGLPTLVPRSRSLAEAASSVHAVAATTLIAVVALHVAAALHHALIRRDGVWQRMWPPRATRRRR